MMLHHVLLLLPFIVVLLLLVHDIMVRKKFDFYDFCHVIRYETCHAMNEVHKVAFVTSTPKNSYHHDMYICHHF